MPSTHPRRLHLLFLHLTLLIHLCTPHPTTPLLTNLSLVLPSPPPPISITAGRDIECFGPSTPKAHPVDLADCPYSIDLLYHDPSGVMELQEFIRGQPVPPHLLPLTKPTTNHKPPTTNNHTATKNQHTTNNHNTVSNTPFKVPFAWQIGGCQVLLTSASDTATDTFRLADVIVKAGRIIDTCSSKNKRSLGGLATVGNGQSFFVAVNGPEVAGGMDLRPRAMGEIGEGEIGQGQEQGQWEGQEQEQAEPMNKTPGKPARKI